ncbi:phospholipase D family protein [Marinicella meishanensis]|uniref:phospholipase D family protein n=1 Tax=Marinicella meishanensis TaxID=2873263 RepID=UPI001CBB9991|nr:phospholipase D family protein [Marinicella sp. NBU2979]
MRRFTIKRTMRWFLGLLVLGWLGMGAYHSFKPLPAGISFASAQKPVGQVRFLADATWVDEDGVRYTEQQIFDRVLTLIKQAERLVVLDMFLFNDFAGAANGHDPNMRPLSDELAAVTIKRKQELPGLRVVLITDPINQLYGGLKSSRLDQLSQAGIEVVMTDLNRLRDSNPTWSGLWRLCCQWWGNSSEGGWIPNPVGLEKVTLRTWLKLLNFKANHRKVLVADSPSGLVGLVTSGNPHDASSAHGNVALEFTGPAVLDLLASEQAVLDFSQAEVADLPRPTAGASAAPSAATIQVLTESQIRDRVMDVLMQSAAGDRVDLKMFYLSHRGIIKALKQAHEQGAQVRVLLDPNEDAFGKKKNGIPNRQVAHELTQAGIPVRWCDTHGEQCHSKMLLTQREHGRSELILGSANYTRRNLDDLNLETNVALVGPSDLSAFADAATYFDLYWHNGPNQFFSQPHAHYADDSRLRYWRYRIMEATGMSTF